MRNIVVMGPPGSGKNTQIDILKEFLHNDVISSGDITRELSQRDKKISEILRSGGLLDDSLIIKEIDARLDKLDPAVGVIFDGFPRTMIQAEELNKILMKHERTLDAVIYLDVDEEEVVKRLSSRKICYVCGYVTSSNEDECPKCGAVLARREDDEPAVIINRMQTFLDKTMPLVSYYKNKGNLLEVNGDQPIEKVTADILDRLEKWETAKN